MHMQVYNLAPPPDDIVDEYMRLGEGVPDAVLQKAVVPRSPDDAVLLARKYLGEDRVGPANTHDNDPDGLLEQVVAGAHPGLGGDDATDRPNRTDIGKHMSMVGTCPGDNTCIVHANCQKLF